MSTSRRGFLARTGAFLTGLFASSRVHAFVRAPESPPEPCSVPGEGSGQPYRFASPGGSEGVEVDVSVTYDNDFYVNNGPAVFTGMVDPAEVQGREGDVYYQPWDRDGEYGCKLWVHTGVGWTRATVPRERGWQL